VAARRAIVDKQGAGEFTTWLEMVLDQSFRRHLDKRKAAASFDAAACLFG